MVKSLMVQLSNNSLSDFVRQVVSEYRNTCESKNVNLLLDLEEVSAPYDRKLVHHAVAAMVENAIEAMPQGGELEATLVNAEFQWELEIADSGTCDVQDESTENDQELPRVIGVDTNAHLGKLNQLSILMNATVQSWNCTLGGTAHVLVVPKPASRENTSQRRAA